MNQKMKRCLLCLLTVLLLLPAFASCKKTQDDVPDGTSGGETVATLEPEEPKWELDENGYVKDTIPEMNCRGKEIHVLCWDENVLNVLPKDVGSKNVVQEEVYLRRLNLETRLNIKFKVSTTPGNAQKRDSFLTQARKANDEQYDLICSFSLHPSVLAQEGLLYNLNNLTYPQLEMPWWPESITEWEQYGGLYFIASNSSVSAINSMEIMLANTSMITELGLKNPIDLVLEGNWTVENMIR